MKAVPWHVKVAPAARETAHEAARRSGLSVGEWLNSVIFGSADERPPRQHARERAPQRAGRNVSAINDRLEHLTRQIDRLAQTKAPGEHDDETPRRLADAIVRLDRRLDQLIQEGRHANSEMERRVTGVDQALAALGQERLRTAFVVGPENVDQAVAEIVARQRALDGDLSGPAAYAPPPRFSPQPSAPQRFETDLSGLEQQLRTITTRIESLQRPCRADEAVAALRQDLADIGRTLSEAMPRRALEVLEGEVRKLATQIEAGRRSGTGESAVAGIEHGLTEVRDALRGLTPAESLVGFDEAVKTLSRKVDMLAGGGPEPAALQQLESAIGGLRGIVSHVASGEALAALAAEVRSLADRVDRSTSSPPSDFLLTLERRIGSIAEAIETVRHEGSRAVPPALDALMQSLSDKLERIALTRTDQLAFGNLEERITRLVEKLDASEAKLGHLGAIERGMAELLVHLEELRAGQAVRGPAATIADPAPSPPVATPAVIPAVVDGLARDVAQVKQTQSVIGRRTEDSLEAVQGTIGDVVNRLAMIESDLRPDTRVPAPASADRTADDMSAPAFDDQPVLPASPAASAAPEPVSAPTPPPRPKPAAPPRQPIDPTLPPDYPLEPGSGVPRGGSGASPADRIAASEAPLRAARAAAPPAGAEDPSNFLQAARRAARAASQQATTRPAAPDPNDPDAAAKTLSDRLKQLFVGAGIILAVAASFRFAGIYLDPDRVILSDAPAPRSEMAQLPADMPSTARTITVPDQVQPSMAAALPPARIEPATTAGFAAVPGFVFAPSSATTIISERSAPAAPVAAAQRSEITGSVPAKQEPAAKPAAAPEPAPPVPPAADQPSAGIGKGLMAAASAGDPAASHEMATRYAEGRGVPQSYKEATLWFERAAKRGLAPAQFRLGTMYEKGLGVTKNLQEARRLYLAAADKGNPKAMHNIAVLYAEGIDGKPDYKAAVQWFGKAANYGIADSQYNLAVLYARGIGIEQNLSESFKWFTLAANSGDQEAAKKREEIAARLDQQALAAARLAAQNWAAAIAPEDATTVKPPAGGWEQAAVPAASTDKPKPHPRGQGKAAAAR